MEIYEQVKTLDAFFCNFNCRSPFLWPVEYRLEQPYNFLLNNNDDKHLHGFVCSKHYIKINIFSQHPLKWCASNIVSGFWNLFAELREAINHFNKSSFSVWNTQNQANQVGLQTMPIRGCSVFVMKNFVDAISAIIELLRGARSYS